jgi:hypothetical protein
VFIMGYKPTVNAQRQAVNVVATASGAITATPTANVYFVGNLTELAVDINVSAVAGTSPTYTLKIERQGADGIYYVVNTGTAITATGAQSTEIGVGATINKAFGAYIRVTETIGGTTPSVTRSLSIVGK